MRMCLITLLGLITVSPALAEPPGHSAPDRSQSGGKVWVPKGTAGANPCAAYGPGFVRVEGAGSCVKVGGTLDVGVAASGRR